MAIDKINGENNSFYDSINGALLATIAKINGESLGAPPPPSTNITFDDLTYSCFPNPTWDNTNPLDFDLPSTIKLNDLVFLFVQTDAPFSGDNILTPAGWTKEFGWYGTTSDNAGYLFWKLMDATDVSTGVAKVYATGSYNRDGQAWSWIGGNVATYQPVEVGVWTESVGISKTIAGITPTFDGLAVGFWGFDGGDGEPTTITAGWTKEAEQECDGTSSGTFGGFASLPTTNGVPTGDLVVTALVSDGWGGVIANLKQSSFNTTNLIHRYTPANYSGTGDLLDEAGTNDLRPYGPSYVSSSPAHFSYDGINDYMAASPITYNATDIAFGVWIYFDDATGLQVVGGLWDETTLDGFIIFVNTNILWYRYKEPGGTFANVNTGITPVAGKWYYMCFSYAASTTYINGWLGDDTGFQQILTDVNTGIAATTANLYPGIGGSAYPLKGDSGNFHIYTQNVGDAKWLAQWTNQRKYYNY